MAKKDTDAVENGKKWRRGSRLAAIALELSARPGQLFTLSELAERYECAKSTLSEDLTALREPLYEAGMGSIETLPGAAGGVRFQPWKPLRFHRKAVAQCCQELQNPNRIMPGDFLYTVDVLSQPSMLRPLGTLLAQIFACEGFDAVLTIEAKGVPIGLMTAEALGVPLAIARKENRATEGSVVTLNYQTTSRSVLQSMSLPRRALAAGQRVLIVDDFVKGGGTVSALCDMMDEFSCEVAGIASLIAAPDVRAASGMPVKAPMILHGVQRAARKIDLRMADWLNED